MRERVAKRSAIRPRAEQLTISTFHSFGLGVLTRGARASGTRRPVHDLRPGRSARLRQGVSRDRLRQALRRERHRVADLERQERVPRAGGAPGARGRRLDAITKIVYPRYQAALRRSMRYDFDDLILRVARALDAPAPTSSREWQERCPFLLVDEYQDTNRAQFELLRLLAGERQNLCVVGDDDQSIYGWRGADVSNILDFERAVPGREGREARTELPLAEAVLDVGERRHRAPHGHEAPEGSSPIAWGATRCSRSSPPLRRRRRVGRDGDPQGGPRRASVPAREVAVLYRSNGQAKAIEEALREQMIPYRVVGGQQFFERKEVKDLLAYMKLALNRADEISLRRILNYPPRGIGDASSRSSPRLRSRGAGRSGRRSSAWTRSMPCRAGARRAARRSRRSWPRRARQLLAERVKPSEAARALCDRIGLRKELEATSPSMAAAARRWGNVDGMFNLFAGASSASSPKAATRPEGFGGSSTRSRSTSATTKKKSREVVTLSTLHGAKGLEFDPCSSSAAKKGSSLTRARSTRAPPTSSRRAAITSRPTSRRSAASFTSASRAPKKRLTISRARRRARCAASPWLERRADSSSKSRPSSSTSARSPRARMSTAQIAENANALLAALEAFGLTTTPR